MTSYETKSKLTRTYKKIKGLEKSAKELKKQYNKEYTTEKKSNKR